jgi:hypothetical protein
VRARVLNVYGYPTTDLFCLTNSVSRLTLLYIPGNASPLHEFSNERQMHAWFARQCQNPQTRDALLEHFAMSDRPDGLSYSGVQTALCGLASYPHPFHLDSNRPGFTAEGVWPPHTFINYKPEKFSPWINKDLFLTLAKRQKARSYQDADFLITSDHAVTKAKWRGYVHSAMNALAPLVLVAPELAPLFAVGGAAQFGLGLDQAINARNLEQQAQGVGEAAFGLLNALPALQEGVADAPELFRVKSNRFVSPSRVNGDLGYPLSPVTPPRLPEPEIADSFEYSDVVTPFPEGDTAVAGAVVRSTDYKHFPDTLQASVDDYLADLVYDLERDAFLLESDMNEVSPVYYIAPQRPARDLLPLQGISREVTHESRMRTLRALGVDLQLPVDFFPHGADPALPIPKVVFHLWVGDKAIAPELLNNLASNGERLRGTQYAHRLYLSNASEAAYAQNLQNLREQVPDLDVRTLEEQAFFEDFRKSEYFDQYHAALTGNDGKSPTFASAADILRYRVLHHEGGLYMDVDDSLLAPGEYAVQIDGQHYGKPAEHIDEVELRTTANGLLLSLPVSHETLNMRVLYNSNMIGSHAGNPTLELISNEIRSRFERVPEFYRTKPDAARDKAGFERFARQLSWLTGPGVMNDVVDRAVPELYTLRQTANLSACPTLNREFVVDWRAYKQAQRTLLPLSRIAKDGHNNSWMTT